jgi:hypothetical protein
MVTTETSGFLTDDSYELLVDGESKGAIGANDAMTLAELDPATYEVTLGDVAENCTVEGTTVAVTSEATATVALTVVCSAQEAESYTLQFNRLRPNLDNGEVKECPFGICDTSEAWDLHVYNSSSSDPHSVIRQNQTTGVQIAHLAGKTFATLTAADVSGATFTTEWVADSFDSDRVILIKTDVGAVYALGNPVENMTDLTLTFDAVLISEAP